MIGSWLPGIIPLVIALKNLIGMTESQLFAIFGVLFGLGGMALSLFNYKAKERAVAVKIEGSIKTDYKLLFKNKLLLLWCSAMCWPLLPSA